MALGSQTDLSLTEIRFLHRDETCMKKTIRSIRGAQRVYGSLRSCTFTLGDVRPAALPIPTAQQQKSLLAGEALILPPGSPEMSLKMK
ncbi:uncharacterized protein CCOS01_13992 [Colletotrichum costaricense]|uniref:Uncharacterized protein n=1 Tax=Colletotrichum costaricense TaxID=1209916 RepID=A0AAI9YKA1_9PEZI|nr:uncharacterized protein CCOS01_13992 [Colletotrichum costaricense]KAK1514052.1 hypothetical protein CCOS01_13992 [Colletotrichum costaricense]